MPTLILFTFTLTVYRLRPFTCPQQTKIIILPVARLATISHTEFRFDASTNATFNLVRALHESCVISIRIATSLRGKTSGDRISVVASRQALGPNQLRLQLEHFRGNSGRELNLPTHCHLTPRLKMCAAIILLVTHVYMLVTCVGTASPFFKRITQ